MWGKGGFSLPANGRIISMFVEWQRRAGGAGTGFTLLGEDDHGGGGRKGLCVGKGAATGVPRGGPKGEEDALAFFVGLFFLLI